MFDRVVEILKQSNQIIKPWRRDPIPNVSQKFSGKFFTKWLKMVLKIGSSQNLFHSAVLVYYCQDNYT